MRLQVLLIATLLTAAATSSRDAAADDQGTYLEQIKPLFAKRCYACHGALKQEGGLRLDTAALAIQGGDLGPAVQPGNPSASLLLQRVSADEPSERMPQEGEPLKSHEIAVIRAWIASGAVAPLDETKELDPRSHWAFRPIVRPPVPQVSNKGWVRNPIDAFIASKLERRGLTPQVEAEQEILMRRLCLDLVGLPPTNEELAELEGELSDAWYERLADRLLNDPRHAERWARHWMDIWRYSDWWGGEGLMRNSQPHIWHWRDWIIDSLIANTPYDEMLRLMLAADELYPSDLDKLRATGFLARNYFIFNRNQWMDETVEHVSKGMLGITINCAKCHDHKYDPIPQVDYYRLRAFFEPYQVRLDVLPTETDLTRDGIPCVFDGVLDAPTYRFERGQENQPDKSAVIRPGVPDLLSIGDLGIQPVLLPADARQPDRRSWVLKAYFALAQSNVARANDSVALKKQRLHAARKRMEAIHATNPDTATMFEQSVVAVADAEAGFRVAELAAEATRKELTSVEKQAAAMSANWVTDDDASGNEELVASARRTAEGAVRAERQATVAKFEHAVADLELRLQTARDNEKESLAKDLKTSCESLEKSKQNAAAAIKPGEKFSPLVGAKWTATRFLSSTNDDPQMGFPAQSTGRRTALARWITDRKNPLTARVAVNHIWARHMGRPLVATVFDFGRNGSPPTDPELLDWLAAELIESGWDMKHLHRLIVLSATYRRSSTAGCEECLAVDPENNLYWRRTPIRLEAEAVRDSILSLSGTLDLTRNGPPVGPAGQAASKRRSIYFFHSNNDRNAFLATFDGAMVKECYRREETIIPQQALALSNSSFVHDAARQIAGQLSTAATPDRPPPNDEEFIKSAFYSILAIKANHEEIRASREALNAWRELVPSSDATSTVSARAHFVWALFNHNDFVTVR